MFQEVGSRHGHELVFARMVHHLVSHDTHCGLRPVLVGVVLKVGDGGVRARHQHMLDAIERCADIGEELMLCAHTAAMLGRRVLVSPYATGLHMFRIKLQDLSAMVVGPDNGVTKIHVGILSG